MHAAAGFPVKTTWVKPIDKGYFKSWPSLTPEAVKKHYPESDATTKGHLKKQHPNAHSTKIKVDNNSDKLLTTSEKKAIYIKIFNAHNTFYTDQMGRMPVTSNPGHRLIMVLFEIDRNFIDAEPLRDSTNKSLIEA